MRDRRSSNKRKLANISPSMCVCVSSAFDECIRKFRVYKVETIGDSYVVTCGLPLRIGDQHAQEMANMALHLMSISRSFSLPGQSSERLPLRIGINCGKPTDINVSSFVIHHRIRNVPSTHKVTDSPAALDR